jgi:hypothetical protein
LLHHANILHGAVHNRRNPNPNRKAITSGRGAQSGLGAEY